MSRKVTLTFEEFSRDAYNVGFVRVELEIPLPSTDDIGDHLLSLRTVYDPTTKGARKATLKALFKSLEDSSCVVFI